MKRLLALALLLLARPAAAGDLQFVNVVGGQLNPRGLGDDFRLRYRHALYRGAGPVFTNNFAGGALGIGLGPGIFRPSLSVEVQPVAPLTFGVAYQPSIYLGVVGLGQGYASPTVDYGSTALGPPPGDARAMVIHQLLFQGSVQMKLGPFVARNAARLTYAHAMSRGSDRVVFDPIADVVVYRRGWLVQNDSDVGVIPRPGLILGARHTLVATWYPSGAFPGGVREETHDSPTSRLGPIVSYAFLDRRGERLESATVAGTAQWYLAHRFRTGDEAPAWLPLVGVTFTVVGNL